MEKKCENCVFYTPKPKGMSFPIDFTCGSSRSKWHGFWPYNSCFCEYFTKPTGITIEEATKGNEQLKQMVEGFALIMGGFWGKSKEEVIEGFVKQDSAVLDEYGWTNREGFEEFIKNQNIGDK